MLERTSPLSQLASSLGNGATGPKAVALKSVECANRNASHNTYISFSEAGLLDQADSLAQRFALPPSRPPLYSIPISLKDCFDLTGTITTCGSKYYADHHTPALQNSAIAERLRTSGALVTGKTHLHALAYGITGENPDYGDCLQPRDAMLLTGGSSSGAAASVQEGSALAAIGTDTGGSIRIPAALCGLAGYRTSHALAYAPGPWPDTREGLWQGGAHLAPSFDTIGLLLRDPRDLAPLAHVLFGVPFGAIPKAPRIGCVGASFLADCDPDVQAAFDRWREQMAAAGGSLAEFDATGWSGAHEVYTWIGAHEAAALHRGNYDRFEPAIAQRLHWGASLTEAQLAPLEQRRADLRLHMAALFERFDFLMLPCAPLSRLIAGEDQTIARQRILCYTVPFSLAGLPAIALPGEIVGGALGTGVQIAAPPGKDAALLAFAGALAQMVAQQSD